MDLMTQGKALTSSFSEKTTKHSRYANRPGMEFNKNHNVSERISPIAEKENIEALLARRDQ